MRHQVKPPSGPNATNRPLIDVKRYVKKSWAAVSLPRTTCRGRSSVQSAVPRHGRGPRAAVSSPASTLNLRRSTDEQGRWDKFRGGGAVEASQPRVVGRYSRRSFRCSQLCVAGWRTWPWGDLRNYWDQTWNSYNWSGSRKNASASGPRFWRKVEVMPLLLLIRNKWTQTQIVWNRDLVHYWIILMCVTDLRCQGLESIDSSVVIFIKYRAAHNVDAIQLLRILWEQDTVEIVPNIWCKRENTQPVMCAPARHVFRVSMITFQHDVACFGSCATGRQKIIKLLIVQIFLHLVAYAVIS